MVFEIFRYNFQNFSKIFKLFLEIILQNFPKYHSKVTEVLFAKFSTIILKIFEKQSPIQIKNIGQLVWILSNEIWEPLTVIRTFEIQR